VGGKVEAVILNAEARRFGDYAEFFRSEKFKGNWRSSLRRRREIEEAEGSGLGNAFLRVSSASPCLRVEGYGLTCQEF
jgi:hypothetical protein